MATVGANPTGYHVTNLALHVAAALLVWNILRYLSVPGAFLAALLFAVHPVNVESVAWISQRKGLLAMMFFLLSIVWYLRTIKQRTTDDSVRTTLWYWLSLVAFVLAMLSKGSVAILPIVLLLIVWWQKGRIQISDIARIAPFLLVAVVLAGVDVWFQKHGTQIIFREATLAQRLMGAGTAVWFYLSKALLPLDLIFIYPLWDVRASAAWLLPLLAALAVTGILLWRLKSPRPVWSRALLFAWAYFCVALAPVMGFTDVGFMRYSLVADHYQYVAIVGVAAAVAAGWSAWHSHSRKAWIASASAVVAIGALTCLSWQQSRLYADAITLYQATLKRNPQCWLIENNLGSPLVKAGRLTEAIEHYHRALQLNRVYPEAHNNLGLALESSGQTEKAIEEFREALRQNPKYAEAHFDLGHALMQAGRVREGIDEYLQALQWNPDYAEAYYNLGLALANTGQIEQAVQNYQRALVLKPDYADAHNNLGNALFKSDQIPAAIEQYLAALALQPDTAETHNNLGSALAAIGRLEDAAAQYELALRLKSDYASAQTNLERVLDASAGPRANWMWFNRLKIG